MKVGTIIIPNIPMRQRHKRLNNLYVTELVSGIWRQPPVAIK